MKDEKSREVNVYTIPVKGVLGTYWFKEGDDLELAKKVIAMAEAEYPQKRMSIALQRYAYIEGVMDYVRGQKKTFWVTCMVSKIGKEGSVTVGAEVTEESGRFSPTEFIKKYIDEGFTCNIFSVVETTGLDNHMLGRMDGFDGLHALVDTLKDRKKEAKDETIGDNEQE